MPRKRRSVTTLDKMIETMDPFKGDTNKLPVGEVDSNGRVVGTIPKQYYIRGDSLIAIYRGRGGSVKRRGVAFVGKKVDRSGRRRENPLKRRLLGAGIPVLG